MAFLLYSSFLLYCFSLTTSPYLKIMPRAQQNINHTNISSSSSSAAAYLHDKSFSVGPQQLGLKVYTWTDFWYQYWHCFLVGGELFPENTFESKLCTSNVSFSNYVFCLVGSTSSWISNSWPGGYRFDTWLGKTFFPEIFCLLLQMHVRKMGRKLCHCWCE